MTTTSPRLLARMAGALYVITIASGVFAAFFVNTALIVRNDPAATASHILAAEPLYRLGTAAELIGTLAYVAVTALLYVLLRPAGRTVSVLAAFFSLVGCAIGAAELAFHIAPLILLGGTPFLAAFTPDQLQALALVFLKLEGQANNVGLICFGFYCMLIGWLIVRSTFLPRGVGILMGLAGLSWLIGGFATILFPALASQLSLLTAAGIAGEASLTLWLLLFGVNAEKWKAAQIGG